MIKSCGALLSVRDAVDVSYISPSVIGESPELPHGNQLEAIKRA